MQRNCKQAIPPPAQTTTNLSDRFLLGIGTTVTQTLDLKTEPQNQTTQVFLSEQDKKTWGAEIPE